MSQVRSSPGEVPPSVLYEAAREALKSGDRGPKERPPLQGDPSPFGTWLRFQAHRHDPIGALAQVASKDPAWPGGHDRQALRSYFRRMGSRPFVLQALAAAFAEFDQTERRKRTRAKNRVAKSSRKANRRPKNKKR